MAAEDTTWTWTGDTFWGHSVYEVEIHLNPDEEFETEIFDEYWLMCQCREGSEFYWGAMLEEHGDMVYFSDDDGETWTSSLDQWGTIYYSFFELYGTCPYDAFPPYVDEVYPPDGETGVPTDTIIIFHCKDELTPVDTDTIDFTLRDTTLGDDPHLSVSQRTTRTVFATTRTVSGDLDIDDSEPLDVVCTFYPDEPLREGDLFTCTVDGSLADYLGNAMGEDFIWTFDTDCVIEETSWGAIKASFE